MLGSLTVALYFVSRCVEHIMGQVLTKITPDSWSAAGAARPPADGRDECGFKLHAQTKPVHHVALRDDEEMVIRESQAVTANGAVVEPRAEAVLVEHAAVAPGVRAAVLEGAVAERQMEAAVLEGAVVEPWVQAAVVGDTAAARPRAVVEPRVQAAVVEDTAAARPRAKRSLHVANEQHLENGADTSVELAGEPEPKRRLPEDFPTLIKSSYPFLDDPETVDYLRTSKVMFVLKGLPGSGKTRLAGRIARVYPGAVICSADDFFMKDGRYEFDGDQLSAAHQSCQQRAEQACRQHRPQIIIDNTNLRNWEWSTYVRLAAEHHYLLVLQEPDTPWRRDPARLAVTNSHRVTEDLIRKKLKSMQVTVPLYYGWILNAADCQLLMDRVKTILQNVFRENKLFADDFCSVTGSADITELSVLYPPPAELLHCTARFCGGRSRAAAARLYGDRPEVRRALGTLSTARVTGLLLTPRSLGARLTLDDAQLTLWDQEDHQATPVKPGPTRPRRLGTGVWQEGGSQPSLAVSGTKRPVRTAAGRRAHITLGCRPDWPPVVTGNDLMAALDVLEARPELLRSPVARVGRVALCRVQDQVWYMDLGRDLVVDAVFGARY